MEKQTGIPVAKRYRDAELYEKREGILPDGKKHASYAYVGKILCPKHPEEVYQRATVLLKTCMGVSAVCLILLLSVPGFAVYEGGSLAFVPAAMALFPAGYGLWGTWRLPKSDRQLQEDTHAYAHRRIGRSARGICALLFLTVLTAVILFAADSIKATFGPKDILFFLLALIPAGLSLWMVRILKELRYEEQKD